MISWYKNPKFSSVHGTPTSSGALCEARPDTTSVTVPPSVVFRQLYYLTSVVFYVHPVEPDTDVRTRPSLLHETRLPARPHS